MPAHRRDAARPPGAVPLGAASTIAHLVARPLPGRPAAPPGPAPLGPAGAGCRRCWTRPGTTGALARAPRTGVLARVHTPRLVRRDVPVATGARRFRSDPAAGRRSAT
jgi:hypothetical protein